MAFNPSQKVGEARSLANKYGKTKVIILMIDDEAGTMEYASYGRTRRDCDEAQALADVAYEAVYDFLAAHAAGVGE